MSQLRSSKKTIVLALTGEHLNRKTLNRTKTIINAIAIQQNLPQDLTRHRAEAKKLFIMENKERNLAEDARLALEPF